VTDLPGYEDLLPSQIRKAGKNALVNFYRKLPAAFWEVGEGALAPS
jgi:hypothetical protein